MVSGTQVFLNREIWSFDTYLASRECGHNDGEPFRCVPVGALKRDYPRSIDSIRACAEKLGFGATYEIEFGFSGADGVKLAVSREMFGAYPGPLYENEVYLRRSVNRETPTAEIFNEFLDKLFDEAGAVAPDSEKIDTMP